MLKNERETKISTIDLIYQLYINILSSNLIQIQLSSISKTIAKQPTRTVIYLTLNCLDPVTKPSAEIKV